MNLIIRPETQSDIAEIQVATVAAFLHAPHSDHTEQCIVDALRNAGALFISLVIEDGGVVVGQFCKSGYSQIRSTRRTLWRPVSEFQ